MYALHKNTVRARCIGSRQLLSGSKAPFTVAAVRSKRSSMAAVVQVKAVLSQKTIVVTGGSQGIGLEFVRQCVEKDNTVIAAVRSPSTATQLQQLLLQQPPSADGHRKLHITTLDVSAPSSIQAWSSSLRDTCPGLRHIDLVINNAGVYGPKADIRSVTSEDMLSVYHVNCIGPLLVVQGLLNAGLLGGLGGKSTVANVSSKVGSVDDNKSGGGYAYRASKSALNIVNKSLSIDLASDGITCVLLHPGYVRTRMTGGQGLIDASESVSGLISVLEGNAGPLNGQWYDYAGKAIPW